MGQYFCFKGYDLTYYYANIDPIYLFFKIYFLLKIIKQNYFSNLSVLLHYELEQLDNCLDDYLLASYLVVNMLLIEPLNLKEI